MDWVHISLDFLKCYIVDIIMFSFTMEKHSHQLQYVFDDLGMHGLKQCWELLIGTLGFQTNSLIDFHNENQILSHLVIIRLRIELTIFIRMNIRLLKIEYFVFNFFKKLGQFY